MSNEQDTSVLETLVDALRDKVQNHEEVAIRATELLADRGALTARQVRNCGLHLIIVQAER
jgi:hypothetical protein